MSEFPEKDINQPAAPDTEAVPAEEPATPEEAAETAEAASKEASEQPRTTADEAAASAESTIFTKPQQTGQAKKPPKKGGSHMVRNIVAALVVLCVLAGAVLSIYIFVPAPEEETASSSSSTVIQLVSMSASDITRIDLANDSGAYAVYPTEDEGAETSTASGDTDNLTWHIEGVSDEYVDTYSVGVFADNAAGVQAMRLIGEDTDLAAYGLDTPRITVTVTAKDEADSFILYFGDDAPNGDGTYLKLSNSSQIYLASTYVRDLFNRGKTAFTNINMVLSVTQTEDNSSYFDEDGALASFDRITISGRNHAQTMEFVPNPYADTSLVPYLMTAPVTQNVMGDVFDDVFHVISNGLTADGGYAFNPTAEQLAAYGLDNPGTVISYKVGRTEMTLKIGNATEDGCYPVMVDDRPVIYKVQTSVLPFVDYGPEGYFSSVLFMDDITSVKWLEMKTPGSDHVYNFTHGTDENDAATLDVVCDDKVINTEDFRNFYQYILRCPASDFTLEPAAEGVEPALVITVHYMDDARPEFVLTFTPSSDRRYHVAVNGSPLGYAAVNTVDQLISYDQSIYAGEAIPTP